MDWSFIGILIMLAIIYGAPLFMFESSPKVAQTVFYVVAAGCTLFIVSFALEQYKKNGDGIAFIIIGGCLILDFLGYKLYKSGVDDETKFEEARSKEIERVASMSAGERKEYEASQAKVAREREERQNDWLYGTINKQLFCPHCQTKGFVRSQNSTKTIKTRVNSLPAKAIGLGTNTKKSVTALRCDNCSMEWEVER
jgi:hypothetical protein